MIKKIITCDIVFFSKGSTGIFHESHLCLVAVTLHGNTLVTFGGSGVPFGEQSSNDIHLGKLDLNMDTVTWSCLRCSGDRPERKYGHVSMLSSVLMIIMQD